MKILSKFLNWVVLYRFAERHWRSFFKSFIDIFIVPKLYKLYHRNKYIV